MGRWNHALPPPADPLSQRNAVAPTGQGKAEEPSGVDHRHHGAGHGHCRGWGGSAMEPRGPRRYRSRPFRGRSSVLRWLAAG